MVEKITQNNCVVTVSCRTASSRLPAKAFLPIASKPSILFLLDRLAGLPELVLATTDHESDDELVDLVTKKHFNVYRGPVDDVFLRLLGVATYVNLPFIVRVTADCPLVDKALVIEAIEEAGKFTQHWDCATTKGITPPGIDLEIFRVSSMSAIYKFLNTAEKEHISNAFANKSLGMVTTRLKLSDYALTRGNFLLDTLSDFLRISKFISEKDISLSTKEILYNLQA